MTSVRARLRGIGKRALAPLTPGACVARDERKDRKTKEKRRQTDPGAGDGGRSGLWRPQPGPQDRAAESDATITGYGGQAGGGKSDLLVGLAVTGHYKASIYRRQRTDAKDLVRRAKEIAAGAYKNLNNTDLVMEFDDGGFVEFAGLKNLDDWEKRKGRDRDYIGFDEVTEFAQIQVMSLIGWLRSTREGQRKRVVMTFNPPTSVEGEWVIELFAPWLRDDHPNPARDGELRWFATVEGQWKEVDSSIPFEHTGEDGRTEEIHPISVTFFRAKLSDNAYLSGNDDYKSALHSLPEPLRSQLLYGDWNASKAQNPWQIIPTQWVKLAQDRWLEREEEDHGLLTALGLDVARGGKDRTAIAPRYRDFIDTIKVVPGVKTPDGASAAKETVQVLVNAGERADGFLLNVDAIGYGSSAAEILQRGEDEFPAGYGIDGVQQLNVGTTSEYMVFGERYKCRNLRTELYFRLRAELDPETEGGATLCLPPGREVISDLCAAEFKLLAGGVIAAESKDEIKKRIGRSPDVGDAILLTGYEPTFDGEPGAPPPSEISTSFTRAGSPTRRMSGKRPHWE